MKDVEIYPSSWYYNACVQGFLEVLAWGLGENGNQIIEKEILKPDGKAVIPGKLMEAVFSTKDSSIPNGCEFREVPADIPELKRIGWWWVEKSYLSGYVTKQDSGKILNWEEKFDSVWRRLFNIYADYPNLAQMKWENDRKIVFLNGWFSTENEQADNAKCSFCGGDCSSFIDERLLDRFFSLSLSRFLGSAVDKVPNFFWNGNTNLIICKHCRSYFLFFHIVHRNRFFINSDSLQVNWYLNHLLSNKIKNDRNWRQQTLMNAIQYDPQLRKSLGSWGQQNMEVIIFDMKRDASGKTKEVIETQIISAKVARLILVPRISSLIGKISNFTIWNMIINEQIEYLPIVIYKSLRVIISGKDNSNDPEIINSRAQITDLIQLYYEIAIQLEKEKGGAGMSFINLQEIRKSASDAPIKLNDNSGKNLVYRLLELTRLNKKSDVYHLLLRIYVTSGKVFPDSLARIFEIKDSELFKNGIYAFVAGIGGAQDDDYNQ